MSALSPASRQRRCLLAAALTLGAAPVQTTPVGVEVAPYGVTRAGVAVERYTLRNAHGTTVGVLSYGGIVDAVNVPDNRGRRANVVLSLPGLAAYEARANFGSIVGRFANRIGGGGFPLDGRRYPLSADPQATVSHGGTPGFGARIWRGTPCATPGCRSVTLEYFSADGENGFPGAMRVVVTYTLGNDDALRIDYHATTDRPTVVNLTNHSYFNLAGAGTVLRQRIRLLAGQFTPLDARKLPTGEQRSVAGTPFDLRRGATIGDRIDLPDPQIAIARGFDHNWVIDGPPSRRRPTLAAQACDPASGRTLSVRTTEPGIQFYTANGFDGSLVDAGGRALRRAAGFALETQHFPDSPNRPEFPSTVLRPGETFRSTTVYRFGAEGCRALGL